MDDAVWTRYEYEGGLVFFQHACPDCDRGLLLAPARWCPKCDGMGFIVKMVMEARCE